MEVYIFFFAYFDKMINSISNGKNLQGRFDRVSVIITE